MSSANRGKFERITKQQMQYYVQFCKQHPEITNKNDASQIYELWSQLVDRLNEMQGPTQSVKMWKETLAHWKNQVRSRLCRHQKQAVRNIITSAYSGKINNELQAPILLHSTEISESTTNAHQAFEIKAEENDDYNSADNDSSTCSSTIPSSFPHITRSHKKNIKAKAQKVNYAGICSNIVKSVEARRKMEEQLYINQLNLISKLDKTLTLMNRVLEKIDRKLDKS